jgi:hypothetical protein
MGVDEIITLDDGKEYILLLDCIDGNDKYFLGVEAINNEPSDHYEVFKQVFENGEYYVEEVEDYELLDKLLNDFEDKFDDESAED